MTKDEWKAAYIKTMVGRGVDLDHAETVYAAVDHDYEDDPTDAADDEMSYWEDDEE